MMRANTAPEHVAAILAETSDKALEREARKTGAGVHYSKRTVERAMGSKFTQIQRTSINARSGGLVSA